MSSDGSVTSSGSRIRQFGLYRTIDARTEEFLRSSRKRQIRQGCACAAISTAITVTVVVTVILVYEYSINSQANVNKKVTSKPNWVGVMNDSDITSISTKFNKKVNFDRTTLKLLPILLKALNQNRYLERILEDYSSSSPPLAGKDSTETFTRNVFSNSKNWLKMPTTRHNIVDYKTSPLIFWKNPTQRQEYLTKIRKIRDYKRMLNYFDKMVNDKNGSNQKKEYDYTERPVIAETVPMKTFRTRKVPQHQPPVDSTEERKEHKSEEKGAKNDCKCPKRLSHLLNKLIAGIQDIIPHIINNKITPNKCSNSTQSSTVPTHRETQQNENKLRPTQVSKTPVRNYFDVERKTKRKYPNFVRSKVTTSKNIIFTSTTSTAGSTPSRTSTTRTTPRTRSTRSTTASTTTTPSTSSATTSTTTRTTFVPTFTSTADPSTTTITIDNTSTSDETIDNKTTSTVPMPVKLNMLMTTSETYDKNNDNDYDFIFKPTDLYTETTTTAKTRNPTTEMFTPIKFVDSSHEGSTAEVWLDMFHVSSLRPRMNVPMFKDDEYDDYFITTPRKSTTESENHELRNTKLEKQKVKTSHSTTPSTVKISKMFGKLKSTSFHPVVGQKDLDLVSMRKLADLIYSPQEKTTKDMTYTTGPKAFVPFYGKYTDSTLLTDFKTTNSINMNQNAGIPHSTAPKDIKRMSDMKLENEETKLNGDPHISENVLDDEFQEEYSYRQMDLTTKAPKKYTIKNTISENCNKTVDTIKLDISPSKKWIVKEHEEKIVPKTARSMLPSMRPSYLEIQRNNEWRQDDHADYDINFNNNIFDLPNIN